jgi:choline kinase
MMSRKRTIRKKPLVIIFAAGKGSRLCPHIANIPKCLLRVGDETLIERQVTACEDAGLDDIVVITGYRDDLIKKTLGKRARYVKNPKYDSTQTLYSFYCTRRVGSGRSQIHIDADNYFDPSLIEALVESQGKNSLLVDFDARLDEEATKAIVSDGTVSWVGKKLPGANVEITGLMKLGAPLADALYVAAAREARAGNLIVHVFGGLNPLLKRYPMRVESIGDAFWIEIDFIADLRRARKMIKNNGTRAT